MESQRSRFQKAQRRILTIWQSSNEFQLWLLPLKLPPFPWNGDFGFLPPGRFSDAFCLVVIVIN